MTAEFESKFAVVKSQCSSASTEESLVGVLTQGLFGECASTDIGRGWRTDSLFLVSLEKELKTCCEMWGEYDAG
jgi:hypothetical protein